MAPSKRLTLVGYWDGPLTDTGWVAVRRKFALSLNRAAHGLGRQQAEMVPVS